MSIELQRGLSRHEAAKFIGVSVTKFIELVKTGVMPKAKKIGERRVWDIRALDRAFSELPDEGGYAGNPLDAVKAI